MYEGKSHTLFAKYAVPQMIGLLFNSVYMIVDGVFIGNRLGRDAMAAAAVSVPLVEILIALSMAVATGAGVLISSHLGQGEKEKARHIFSLAALCTAVMGLLISVLGNIFIHPLAELLGSTPVIHDEAISYMWYMKNRKYNLLPYETIVKATAGEPEAVNTVIQTYTGYIKYLSYFQGSINDDIQDYLKASLMEALPKFRFDR